MILRQCVALAAAAAVLAASPALAQISSPPADTAPTAAGIRWSKDVPVIARGEWNGARLADGQPDVQGFYSNTISNHSNFIDPQAGPPGEPSGASKLPRDQRAPSRVSDTADGRVPYLPAARALQEDFAKNFANPRKPKYIEPLARCAPGGVPKSFMWHGYEIRQYPGLVLFLFDSGSRIIYLNESSPRLSSDIKLWNGESRGRWEGNTLVVDVTNNNGKALFGRYGDFMSENGVVLERYIFDNNRERYNYVATFTDPTVYSRPWTATIPVRRFTEADTPDGWHYEVKPANLPGKPLLHEKLERICVENNGPFGGGGVGVPSDGPVISR